MKTELSGKVKLETQYEANLFLCQWNPLSSKPLGEKQSWFKKLLGKLMPAKKSADPSKADMGFYLVSSIAHEPQLLFDNVRAWVVTKETLPISLTSNGKLIAQNRLGDYGYYLTEDGFLISKRYPGKDATEGDKEVYYREEYEKAKQ